MPSILIKRKLQTTDQTSPWDGICFVHDVDSDDLADALRTAFPRCRTLRERKLAATIDFFQHELAATYHGDNIPVSMKTPPLSVVPGMSPAAFNTPMETDEDQLSAVLLPPPSPIVSRSSAAYRHSPAQTPLSIAFPADPTLAATSTQLVFSSLDGRPMPQKTKRKMTKDERDAYKATRKRGACLRCKRQKGKCTHVDEGNSETEKLEVVESSSHNSRPSKALRLDPPLLFQNDTDSLRQDGLYLQQQQSPHQSRRSSNASDRSSPNSNGPHWPTSNERGAQDATSGYVNHYSPFEQAPSYPSNQVLPCFPELGSFDMDLTDSIEYSQASEPHNASLGRIGFQNSPSIQVHEPSQDNQYFSCTGSVDDQWTYGMPPYPENTGMT